MFIKFNVVNYEKLERDNWRPIEQIFQLEHFFVNDEPNVDVKVPQAMHCIICYNRLEGLTILK
jgi:hypothetical protein